MQPSPSPSSALLAKRGTSVTFSSSCPAPSLECSTSASTTRAALDSVNCLPNDLEIPCPRHSSSQRQVGSYSSLSAQGLFLSPSLVVLPISGLEVRFQRFEFSNQKRQDKGVSECPPLLRVGSRSPVVLAEARRHGKVVLPAWRRVERKDA